MPLPIGGFIAAALGTAALGYGGGVMERKNRLKYESEQMEQKVLMDFIGQAIQSGTYDPATMDPIIKKYAGPKIAEIAGPMGMAVRRQMESMQQQFGQGGQAWQPSPQGAPAAAAPPSQPAGPLGQFIQPAPQGAPASAAPQAPPQAPQAGPGEAVPTPAQQLPGFQRSQMQTLPTTTPQPRLGAPGTMQPQPLVGPQPPLGAPGTMQPMQAPPTPATRPRVGNLMQGLTGDIGVKREQSFTMGVGPFKQTIKREWGPQQKIETIVQRAQQSLDAGYGVNQSDLAGWFSQAGVLGTPEATNALKNFGEVSYNAALRRRVAGARPNAPLDYQEAVKQSWMETGYLPDKDRDLVFPNQQATDQAFLQGVARLRPQDVATVIRAWPTLFGNAPSQQAAAQVMQQARAARLAELQGTNQNPNAIAQQLVREGLGTPADEQAAAARAPIGQEATEQLAREGRQAPSAAGLTPEGAGPAPTGAPAAAGAFERAQQEKATQAGRTTRETTLAGGRARQELRPSEPLPPDRQGRIFDPVTLKPMHPQTIGELEGGLKSGTHYELPKGINPEYLQGLGEVEGYVNRYQRDLEILRPVMANSALWNTIKASPYIGMKDPLLGKRVIPPGLVPQSLTRLVGLGLTQKQAEALIDFNDLNAQAPILMRQFGQRGNVPQQLVQSEITSLPSPTNTSDNNFANLKALGRKVEGRRTSIGLPKIGYGMQVEEIKTGKKFIWGVDEGPVDRTRFRIPGIE